MSDSLTLLLAIDELSNIKPFRQAAYQRFFRVRNTSWPEWKGVHWRVRLVLIDALQTSLAAQKFWLTGGRGATQSLAQLNSTQ
jgi:hypothetical protein